jgi:hypothetical protein
LCIVLPEKCALLNTSILRILTKRNPYGKTYGANSILVKTSATGKCLRTRELHAIWDGMGCLTDAARKQYPPDTGNIIVYPSFSAKTHLIFFWVYCGTFYYISSEIFN